MAKQRLLPIKHGYNFRDLGGYPTTDGQTVKWDRLIRTGSLAQLDSADLTTLTDIPVAVDIDLRAPEEVKQAPDRVPTTAKYYHLPVFSSDETDASHSDEEIAAQMQEPGNGFKHMLDVYNRMTTVDSAKQAYQQMFELLLSNPDGAILYHCTAGKDRTGMASFLILSALGVDQQVILEDYLLTNTVTQDFRNKWLQQLRDRGASEALVTNRAALSSVAPDYLNAAIKIINEQYGDVKNYLTDYLKLTNNDLQQLRHLYLA